ncbi:hypothetical protein GRI97_13615 [Altererythrobacter xixiisoli]|uniref:Uncharacterized protein n=1 Tax=Croceibacterium xixiisoli TaxID=1476466 RepID=A0A6I4TVC2_9SPHN|nr:hypothetical protein [Croceibacterium xixiisoli]MXP00027.1 hypothetical protein [Croceibacterium xixiisoli]
MEYELQDLEICGEESSPCFRHVPSWTAELQQMQPDSFEHDGMNQQ